MHGQAARAEPPLRAQRREQARQRLLLQQAQAGGAPAGVGAYAGVARAVLQRGIRPECGRVDRRGRVQAAQRLAQVRRQRQVGAKRRRRRGGDPRVQAGRGGGDGRRRGLRGGRGGRVRGLRAQRRAQPQRAAAQAHRRGLRGDLPRARR